MSALNQWIVPNIATWYIMYTHKPQNMYWYYYKLTTSFLALKSENCLWNRWKASKTVKIIMQHESSRMLIKADISLFQEIR